MKLDAKFYGEIRKAKDDSVVPDDQYAVFLAKDTAFWMVLTVYRAICETLGADEEQLRALNGMIDRVNGWRAKHPELCKVPDAKGERMLDVHRGPAALTPTEEGA